MKKLLLTSLAIFFSGLLRNGFNSTARSSLNLTRLKMSLLYLKSIKTVRMLFISLLGVGTCLIFLFAGILLFTITLLLYTSWSFSTKMCLGFSFAAIYCLISAGIFYCIFAQETWMDIFQADNMMDGFGNEKTSSTHSASEEK